MIQKGLVKSTIVDYDEKGVITVAANAFGNIDSDRDISMPGSFQKTIKEHFSRVRWFKNHKQDQSLGVPLEAKESDEYLILRGEINLEKQIGRDTYSDYKIFAKHGLSLEHSVGVDAVKFIHDRENNVRKISEWKFWEYSTLDGWGANERTPALDIKNHNPTDLKSRLSVLELLLKEGDYRDETFIEIEKSIYRIKSLLDNDMIVQQPVPIDVLTDVSRQFINSLQIN